MPDFHLFFAGVMFHFWCILFLLMYYFLYRSVILKYSWISLFFLRRNMPWDICSWFRCLYLVVLCLPCQSLFACERFYLTAKFSKELFSIHLFLCWSSHYSRDYYPLLHMLRCFSGYFYQIVGHIFIITFWLLWYFTHYLRSFLFFLSFIYK